MKLILKNKKQELGDIWSFFFVSDDLVTWNPGQYINLTMPDVAPVYADRLFTIASAPHEKQVQITTIITPSPFKQRLATLNIDDEVDADQLGGDFTYEIPPHVISNLQSDLAVDPKRLFIAGGIGVTPYISIIRDRLHKSLPIEAALLYAGKKDRRPFTEELYQAKHRDASLIIREYQEQRLTLQKLIADFPDISSYIVYLAGSQKFSETLGEGLIATGHPRNQIKYDYFDGYIDIEY